MKFIKISSGLDVTIKRMRNTPVLLVLGVEILLGLVVSSFAFFIFWEIFETVLKKERFIFDNAISMFFYHLRSPFLTPIMQFFTFIGMDGILVLSVFPLVIV